MSALTEINKYVDPKTIFVLDRQHPQHNEYRNLFFRNLRILGAIAPTCDLLGLPSNKVRKLRDTDPDFAQGIQSALDDLTDDLEAEVYRRAKTKSDLLLMFALKKLNPSFRENAPAVTNNTYNVKAYIGINPDTLWDEQVPQKIEDKLTKREEMDVTDLTKIGDSYQLEPVESKPERTGDETKS